MKIPIYQVDAFATQPFEGNPAAVCVLDKWLDDRTLLNIAIENNLSETAFIVKADGVPDTDYHLRWFTPAVEVDLCGHATIAAAKVIYDKLGFADPQIRFSSASGPLGVLKMANKLVLDFPSRKPVHVQPPQGSMEAIGARSGAVPIDVLKGERDYLYVYDSAEAVKDLKPNFSQLKRCGLYGFIATALGEGYSGEYDFVSRGFFPAYNIDEDPVTGSAHCVSGPYWAEKLGKSNLFARQISARGGDLWLTIEQERVKIAGDAVLVLQGELTI